MTFDPDLLAKREELLGEGTRPLPPTRSSRHHEIQVVREKQAELWARK